MFKYSYNSILRLHQCSLLIFIHMFILPEGKTGETWELSEIGEYYVEKYLRLVLVLSVKFGPTKGCSNRAKQWDAPDLTMNTDSLRILNCEAEAISDSHRPGVAVADFWVKQNTHAHTHSMPLPAQTQSRPILLLCQVLHLPNPSTIFVHFSHVRSVITCLREMNTTAF